jgi:hypothetical protein
MSPRRGAMPVVRLQWYAWALMVMVLGLAIASALLLIIGRDL